MQNRANARLAGPGYQERPRPAFTATSPCPECGHEGPHEDNGESGCSLTFLCTACGMQFDAYPL
jgi:hypothetical protein